MMGGDSRNDKGGAPGPSTNASAPTTPGHDTPDPSPATSEPASPSPSDGTIPAAYLGTWTATIDNAKGTSTRQLTIAQGAVGDTVLTLVADGPLGGGTYHCVFGARLAEQPTTGGPLEIGPSTVTTGDPASACTPGAATEVTLLPDGSLERVNTSSGEKLTYTKE